MPLSRRRKTGLAVAAIILCIPVIALIVLANVDWNRAKPWLNARTSDALGRPFAIHGDLSLTWDRGGDGAATGWQRLLPWPHLVAKDVHIGNPAAMQPDDMGSVSEFSFSINPAALLRKTIDIPELRFQAPAVFLQRKADGSNNWTFKKSSSESPWELKLERIVLTKGTLRLQDASQRADVTADIDTINDPRYGIAWTLKGKVNGDTVTGSGKAGAVLSLTKQTTPFPISANVKAGLNSLSVEGTLTKPSDLAALDMRLKVSGTSMARLYPLTGLVLPETPPFATEGHLTGELGTNSSHWVYDHFTGKVGDSDIGGKLDYQSRRPRGLLSGAVSSRLLVFKDLGPLVGADSDASKAERGAVAAAPPSGRVLPVETFKTERWTSIDTDVTYAAAKIIRDKDLPLSNLYTHIVMKDGVLSLLPLNFDIAGGKLAANIKLDGSGTITKDAIRAELKASARRLQIKQLFPTLDGLHASVGQVNGDASLTATGNSVASLLGASNGEVKTLINEGTISKLLLEEMGLNVGNIVLSKLFGDKQVKLNCMATDFAVTNGLMQTRSFIVDTDEAVINVSGDINLANEKLDLTLKPDTKGFRVFSLRAPLYVTGTFKDPNVGVDKKVVGLRAGGAVALAVLAPFTALLPLVSAGPDKDSQCAKLLANARVTPVAPPPGKTLRGKPAAPKS